MQNKVKKTLSISLIITLLILLLPASAAAAQYGDYTYELIRGQAIITGYTGNGGALTVPSSIGLTPVAAIDDWAFSYNTSITSVNIPASITQIGQNVFYGCIGLTSIAVNISNANFSSANGVLYDKAQTKLICYPAGKTGADFTLPATISTIDNFAFANCPAISRVFLSLDVLNIGSFAFVNCHALKAAYFAGAQPAMGSWTFDGSAPDFKAYYHISQVESWSTFNDYPKQAYCNLTLDLKDGSTPASNPVPVSDGKIQVPTLVSKPGYSFGGWYQDTDLLARFDFVNSVVSTDLTLFAKWIPATPAAPKAVTVSSYNYNTIKLAWSASTYASGYTIFRSPTSGGTFTQIGTTTSTTFNNTGLTTGTTYYYKIKAYRTLSSGTLVSPYSSQVFGKPVPSVPGSLTVSPRTYNSLKISWSAVPGATAYEISRSTTSGSGYTVIASAATGTSYINTGLTVNTTYYYKIRAYRTVNLVKIYSGYTAAVPQKALPATVTGLVASRYNDHSIYLKWNAVSEVTGYQIFRSSNGYSDWVNLGPNATTSCYNYNLPDNRTYWYKVRAYKVINNVYYYGSFSNVSYAKT